MDIYLSNCCYEPLIEEIDVCSKCREPCERIYVPENDDIDEETFSEGGYQQTQLLKNHNIIGG